MAYFRYDHAIVAAFPAIRGGVIHATGLDNGPSPVALRDLFVEEQQTAIAEIGDTPLSDIPSIKAWRRAFGAFGVKPTQYRSAIESLLRRLTKQGSIPSINTLVDIANLVSIRHRLPVAVFDQVTVTGGTTVRFAEGNEQFTDLGSGDTSHPHPGEVIFVDEAGLVSARRWCWRQSRQSAAGPTTADAVITVEGLHPDANTDVMRATEDLEALLGRFQFGVDMSSEQLPSSSP